VCKWNALEPRSDFSVYALNLSNHQNWHDVYSNVESPRFGTFAGNLHRVDGFVIDIID